MARVLILFAHPAYQRSRVNRVMAEAVTSLDCVTFRDLYEEYPELDIDPATEQQLLSDHDVVIFQHPFFWYSTPAILKEWQDLVLEHGWAYGSAGNALAGKKMLSVITTGGGESAYQKDGYNRFTIRQLLTPVEQTAYLCGMTYLPPFTVHGTLNMPLDEAAANAKRYFDVVAALGADVLDFNRLEDLGTLNTPIERLPIQKKRKNHAE